jgi:ribonuclease HI
MQKNKFYVVWKGAKPGIYSNWDDCKAQINGFPQALYKSFPNLAQAEEAFKIGLKGYNSNTAKKTHPNLTYGSPIAESIAVDAACSSATGKAEYQGVYTKTKELLFRKGPFDEGTNNIGEFLAIVHGLAFCKQKNINLPIYTDSQTAMAWVKRKKANTKREESNNNQELFELIERAEKWLQENTWTNPILKWDTKNWGEIPADFGRK